VSSGLSGSRRRDEDGRTAEARSATSAHAAEEYGVDHKELEVSRASSLDSPVNQASCYPYASENSLVYITENILQLH
jgi:hypothetical protein